MRERWEKVERQFLGEYAAFSAEAKRKVFEDKDPYRTEYQRDRDRIVHSKSFRRLKHKTQVFIAPEKDHYRTRLTHTLEVCQIARTIGRMLRLNEDLIEAISLGHDLGHTPFGHSGEEVLNELSPCGFAHNEHSVRVVEVLERRNNGMGLNLTLDTLDGILHHSKGKKDIAEGEKAKTLEGQVVMVADRIAYLNHDFDDAVRAGLVRVSDLPDEVLRTLGESHSQRIESMVLGVVRATMDNLKEGVLEVNVEGTVREAMDLMKDFMFEEVYGAKSLRDERERAVEIVRFLYQKYKEVGFEFNGKKYSPRDLAEDEQPLVDYIAGMTDRYAINEFFKFFTPKRWVLI